MQTKRIKVKSQITTWQLVLVCLMALVIIIGVFYLLFTQHNLSFGTHSDAWDLIFFLILTVPIVYKQALTKNEYLSEICITEQEIKLIYKIRDKITKTETIQKNNIKSFDFNVDINVTDNRYIKTNVNYNIFIDLIEGYDRSEKDTSGLTLVEGNYKFVYRVLSVANDIPNFNFNLNTNNDFVKAELDYFRRFGKPIPNTTKSKMVMNKMPLWLKILIVLPVITGLFCIGMLIYLSNPTDIGLSSTEKEYINLINNSSNYSNNYSKALHELDKARILISTDPYLYYRYAYIYEEKLKDYDTAIKYAKIGISNLGNPEIYSKQRKFTKHNTDVYLYDELGDCYRKLGEWEKAVEAYTYVANGNKWKYSDVYFTRGRMYFKLEKYNEAKQDFLKHRDVIIDYMNTYPEDSNNKRYDNDDLTNINKWINACNI